MARQLIKFYRRTFFTSAIHLCEDHSSLDKIIKYLQNDIKLAARNAQESLDTVKDQSDTIVKKLRAASISLVGDVNKLLDHVHDQIKNPDKSVQELTETYEKNMKALMDHLKTVMPEGYTDPQRLRDDLRETIKNIQIESKKLSEKLQGNVDIKAEMEEVVKKAKEKANEVDDYIRELIKNKE